MASIPTNRWRTTSCSLCVPGAACAYGAWSQPQAAPRAGVCNTARALPAVAVRRLLRAVPGRRAPHRHPAVDPEAPKRDSHAGHREDALPDPGRPIRRASDLRSHRGKRRPRAAGWAAASRADRRLARLTGCAGGREEVPPCSPGSRGRSSPCSPCSPPSGGCAWLRAAPVPAPSGAALDPGCARRQPGGIGTGNVPTFDLWPPARIEQGTSAWAWSLLQPRCLTPLRCRPGPPSRPRACARSPAAACARPAPVGAGPAPTPAPYPR